MENVNVVIETLVSRREQLVKNVLPDLKKDFRARTYKKIPKIWDTENEVKEIDWLLHVYSQKGYQIPKLETYNFSYD